MIPCHLCGEREAESTSGQHPICHPCRQALWERSHQTPKALARLEEDARRVLQRAVVALRRVHAARFGLGSLHAHHPLPNLTRSAKTG